MPWRLILSITVIVTIYAALGAGPTSQPTDENGLSGPHMLALEQLKAGNPMAPYVELIKREKDYDASKMWRDMYWDVRGTRASFLGDQRDAQACFDRVERGHNTRASNRRRSMT